jgi:hypothetical protein
MDGRFVAEFELKRRRLLTKPLNDEPRIIHVANNYCANVIADIENVGD